VASHMGDLERHGKVSGRLEVLDEEAIEKLRPPEWLIEGVLTAGGLSCLFGPPGRGKTFLALDFAFSIASGKAWVGREVKKGAVWYVAGEGVYDLQPRKKSWQEDRGVKSVPTFYAIRGDINMADPSWVAELLAAIREYDEEVSVIIIDTLARCCVGVDENSVRELGAVIHQCDFLRRETGAAVLLLHHTTKDEGQERGSSCLKGAVDTMIKLNGKDDRVDVICEKQRSWKAFDPMAFALEEVGTSCVLVPVSRRSGELDFKDREFLIATHRLMLVSGGYLAGDACDTWCEMTGKADKTFRTHKAEWRQAGLIEEFSGRIFGTDKLREMFSPGETE
jgi:KaiC/GvpD/RAD55 family RecA-like ATPase